MRILLIALTVNLIISFDLSAKIASVIGDPVSGDIYFNVNKDTKNYPASLTKMMTLYIIFDSLRNNKISKEDKVVFSHNAANQQPSRLNIPVGKSISVNEIISGLIIKSGNDAAIAIAEKISGTEKKFVKLMNVYAQRINMKNTNFANPNGLPNKSNISSAYDMFLLGSAIYNDFPEYRKYFNKTKTVINGVKYNTHNKLVSKYKYYKGLKTGYIRKSGFQIALLGIFDEEPMLGIYFGGNSAKERNDKIHFLMNKIAKELNTTTNKVNKPLKNNTNLNYKVQTSSFRDVKKSKEFVLSLIKKKYLNEIEYLTHNIEKKGKYFITITNSLSKNNAYKLCELLKDKKLDCFVKRI